MRLSTIEQSIKNTRNDFHNFAAEHFSHKAIASAYNTLKERQRALLYSTLGVNNEKEFIEQQRFKLQLVALTPKLEESIKRYEIELGNIFRAGYTADYDLWIKEDFDLEGPSGIIDPYTNKFVTIGATKIIPAHPSYAKERVRVVLQEKTPSIASFSWARKIRSIAQNIMNYIEKTADNKELLEVLHTLDARYPNEQRPRFTEMMTDALREHIAGAESTIFDPTGKTAAYFPDRHVRKNAKFNKPLNEILNGLAFIEREVKEWRNSSQHKVSILPECKE